MLDPGGPSAETIADLWWLLTAIGVAVFVLVVAVLALGLRRGGEDPETTSLSDRSARRDQTGGSHRPEPSRWWLWGGGIALPGIIITVVLVATVATMRALPEQSGTQPELTIDVVGRRWQWEANYPSAGVSVADEIHIPAGEPVLLQLRSEDVIHSFWVPALAGKMDLLPERENTLVIEAEAPGRYDGVCAEFCGQFHTTMDMVVVAHTAEDFRSWLSEQADAASGTVDG